jgi:hypothetical protein
MTGSDHPDDITKVPCCPELKNDCPCDVLDFHYRLIHNTTVRVGGQTRLVPVEVKIHARLERCPGPLALGDLVYSTTLLPGEKVRLFTSDRQSRFTYDAATKLSYRHESLSAERFYMASMHDFMSDVTVRDAQSANSQSQGSWSASGGGGYWSVGFAGGGSVNASGRHNSSSTSEFLRELSSHAQMSDRRAVTMTRAAHSVSLGEVASRTRIEGQSEEHFESSTRTFANPNRCHAITFYFYQINKTQKVKYTIEAIERRVIDAAAETGITNNPPKLAGNVTVIPTAVLATDPERLRAEQAGRLSVAADRAATMAPMTGGSGLAGGLVATAFAAQAAEPLTAQMRTRALQQVDADLVKAGLLDRVGGVVAKELKVRLEFETCTSVPTPGFVVRGCLDGCDICEPEVKKLYDLEIEHQRLVNEELKKRIELMEKDQEHRCCPPAPAGGTT